MDFKDLTPEPLEQARACKSAEEFAELAESFGVKLSDEELEAISGGNIADGCIRDLDCPLISKRPQCIPYSWCSTLFSCPEDCESYAPCQINVGPIPVPEPKE